MSIRSQINRILCGTLAVLLTFLPATTAFAGGSDLALFSGGNNVAPNILIIMDTSGSMDDPPSTGGWVSKRTIAGDAIESLVRSVNQKPDLSWETNARFGLMTYVINAARLRVPIGATNADTSIISVVNSTIDESKTPLGGSLVSAGRYYAGSYGWGTFPKWGSHTFLREYDATLYPEVSASDPIDLACRDNYVIFMSDGLPSEDYIVMPGFWETVGDADGDDGDETTNGGSGGISEDLTDGEAWNPSDPNYGFADEVANAGLQWADDLSYAMANEDFSAIPGVQSITTHVIGFDIDSPILERIAENGKGTYYTASDATTLAAALKSAVDQTFDGTATFSTAVVPTSRTIGGSAFYNAYFEPSDDTFWEGHLEAYGLSAAGDVMQADGVTSALDASGNLKEDRTFHWDAAVELQSDVSRVIYTTIGGVQERFEDTNTNLTAALLDLSFGEVGSFPNGGGGAADLAALRANVINYLHGKDAFLEEGSTATAMRSAVLGDIFHSTPRIVAAPARAFLKEDGYGCNLDPVSTEECFYKSYLDRDRVIYAGANDGMLHAFEAGELETGNDPITPEAEAANHQYYSVGDGSENFGYIPGLLLDKVKMVPRNNPRTWYYVDGAPIHSEAWLGDAYGSTAYVKEASEWATVLVTSLREGGAGYFALDITDPDAGSLDAHGPYPKLLWEFTDSKLGQSWSDPVITRIKMAGAADGTDHCGPVDGDGDCYERWVAIFSGGYDPAGDPNVSGFTADHTDGSWTDKGKAIYVVALDNGQILARIDHSTHAAMDYSIPSTPAVIDVDTDGFADVIYVGDLGGQMWKWNIDAVGTDGGDADTFFDNWTARRMFITAPTDMGSGVFHYRSIYYPPAASWNRRMIALSFGTGERENLQYAGVSGYDENNRFYTIHDRFPVGAYAGQYLNPDPSDRTLKSMPYGEAQLTDVTSAMVDGNPMDLGAYIVAEDGEKFTSETVVFGGMVLATSFSPTGADLCAAVNGVSYLYSFRLSDNYGRYQASGNTAQETRRKFIGQGLASSPRVSMAPDPSNDKVFVKTSKSQVIPEPAPEREDGGVSVIYWKQNY